MANLINATVYQIDGNPQKVPIVVAFDTDKIRIQETTLSTIPAVSTFIEVQGEKLNSPVVKYFVNETISSLVTPANSGGTTLLQATVVAINENPFKASVQMAFPANKVTVWEYINGDIQSFLQFNEDKFYATESKATLVAAANSGSGISSVTGFGVNNSDPFNPIVNSFTTGTLTATGTNRNNAALITAFSTNITGGALNTGVRLPSNALYGHKYYIYNISGTDKKIYCTGGFYVNNLLVVGTTGITLSDTFIFSFTLTSVGWLVNQEQVKETAPYKVYTALLTQSGGDNLLDISSGAVTKGVTYTIDGTGSDADFSNVGGPKYDGVTPINGISFVATNNNIPNNYSEGVLIYNTGAPVVTVLENTIGNIYWTYLNIGQYRANLTGAFLSDKTFIATPSIYILLDVNGVGVAAVRNSDDFITVASYDSGNPSDGVLQNFPIEIRVYN